MMSGVVLVCECAVSRPPCAAACCCVPQSTYSEVRAEYGRFQRPADFEPRLAAVTGRLADVQRRTEEAETESDQPDTIQTQMDSCLVSGADTLTH